jgi:hypothetical protein
MTQTSNNKRSAAIVAAFAVLIMAFAAFTPLISTDNDEPTVLGDGEIDLTGFIPVSSPADLALIGSTGDTTGTYPLNGKYYLTDDITLSGTNNHTPIGTSAAPFTGTFYGNGYMITGLNISASSLISVGLFGYVAGGNLINITLMDVMITTTVSQYTGGLVGYATVGYYGAVQIIISDCSVSGSIYASLPSSHIGGIAGSISTQGVPPAASKISGCSFSGAVLSSSQPTTTSNASLCAGGIVGYSEIAISYCHNDGDIFTSAQSVLMNRLDTYAGGIVGHQIGSVMDCYNTGTVNSGSGGMTYVYTHAGGIVGAFQPLRDETTHFSRCYNTGDISATSATTSTNSAQGFAGGIIGSILSADASTVSNCYNTGDISATSSQHHAYAGGLIGLVSSGSILNCYNIGDVTATGNTRGYAGGLTGLVTGGSILNCYSLATPVFGITPSPSNVDGISPKRTTDQISGAKTVAQMKPTLGDAQSGNSIYYTGTTNYVFAGWDFINIWTIDTEKNNGFPVLGESEEIEGGEGGNNGGDHDESTNLFLFDVFVIILAIIGIVAVGIVVGSKSVFAGVAIAIILFVTLIAWWLL